MWTRMNLARFFCCLLVVAVIEMRIARAELEPTTRLIRSAETTGLDIQLKDYVDFIRHKYEMRRPRLGKRNDAAPMMELNATWETLKMIQDAQRQNEQRRQENIRQNKEQIPLRDFLSSDADEYMSGVATRSGSLSNVIDKYYYDI